MRKPVDTIHIPLKRIVISVSVMMSVVMFGASRINSSRRLEILGQALQLTNIGNTSDNVLCKLEPMMFGRSAKKVSTARYIFKLQDTHLEKIFEWEAPRLTENQFWHGRQTLVEACSNAESTTFSKRFSPKTNESFATIDASIPWGTPHHIPTLPEGLVLITTRLEERNMIRNGERGLTLDIIPQLRVINIETGISTIIWDHGSAALTSNCDIGTGRRTAWFFNGVELYSVDLKSRIN